MMRVVVCGSGPAGLWAARRAAEAGAQVTVLEARKRLGAKLLVSGAGKCNFTNVLNAEGQARRFGRQWRFMMPALEALPPELLIEELAKSGVRAKLVDGQYYFPESDRAGDVLDAFKSPGVSYITATAATRLLTRNGAVAGVVADDGTEYAADALILATGGVSYPQLGAVTDVVYTLAEQAGHKVTPLYPGLVGLTLADKRFVGLAGQSLENAGITFEDRAHTLKSSGVLLFTHTGLSGPAVLDIAHEVARAPGVARLRWHAERNGAWWEQFFMENARKNGKKLAVATLGGQFTRRVAELIFELGQVPLGRIAAELGAAERRNLAALLAATPLEVTGTDGWSKAMVTSGGVALKEVEAETLGSRILPGLFFAGELLDLAGPCGGFNIQWACSSGALAGSSAARRFFG